jgi:hypothetical protein
MIHKVSETIMRELKCTGSNISRYLYAPNFQKYYESEFFPAKDDKDSPIEVYTCSDEAGSLETRNVPLDEARWDIPELMHHLEYYTYSEGPRRNPDRL